MLKTAKNIAVSALDPQKTGVMARKVLNRFIGARGSLSLAHNRQWLEGQSISDQDWLKPDDAALWALAQARYQEFLDGDVRRIRGLYPPEIHGPGGAYAMLYFLVRKHQPQTVVETGISLGTSSHAILRAMQENKEGKLYSSDFPYFRVENPEKYIGLLVPEEKEWRDRWHIFLEGDAKNLPAILETISQVDLFHYDSDKSIEGRDLAYKLMAPKMARGGMMLFDDIHDNPHFHDLVKREALEARSRIIEYHGKYIGVIEGF
ncbi:MAG: class I SAM-dependent methyltransferase [Pseudomonadota bacterium]